ncbi:FMN-binding glutamate synthase family protein [Mammaliicoccus lentus]|uniref:FMN-binding glutamate synthase family protein n=1 Tax=Mammaliicoccus lentus TaxID=42858 RepID=UPI001BD9B3C5|nr:FMN-binding glutamate synthase family protein [Mammaliicoccus lentus]
MTFLSVLQLIVNILFFVIIIGLLITGVTLYIIDKRQKHHSVLRNYPLLGRARYFLESVGPELRQYLILNDNDGKPFSRKQYLNMVMPGKYKSRIESFGSKRQFEEPGFYIQNSMFPIDVDELEINQKDMMSTYIYNVDNEGLFDRKESQVKKTVEPYKLTETNEMVIGPELKHPFVVNRLVGQSGMSYGALGKNAITALSKGLARSGSWMNTGEGGLSDHHLSGDCDIIFQIGPGLFGVRDKAGNFDEDEFIEKSKIEQVKAFELKLAQGAKTRGGHIDGKKITKEIAEIRNVTPYETVNSPNRFEFLHNNLELLQFVDKLRNLSEKPVGIKIVVGNIEDLKDLISEMSRSGIIPDFITVDGSEGGTGATFQELTDTVGLPLFTALPLLDLELKNNGIRDKVKVFASGKLITPDQIAIALGLGADLVNVARSLMINVGCIMAQQCHTNNCPVGVATTDPKKETALVVSEKEYRVSNYIVSLHEGLFNLAAAVGVKSPNQIEEKHILYRSYNGHVLNGIQYKKPLYNEKRAI